MWYNWHKIMTVNIQVKCGLCNRLRAITSARHLVKGSAHRLQIWWKTDNEMNVRFTDLFTFDDTCGFELHEGLCAKLASPLLFRAHNPRWFDPGRTGEFVQCYRRGGMRSIWLSTYSKFMDGSDYSWLRPRPDITQEIARLDANFGPDRIGLHIRRTDNAKAISRSPDELFLRKIENLLKADPLQKFFLATDSESVKERFVRTFGACIQTRTAVAKRASAGGVRDAVIDLMLLAACKKLYGSYWSSFSEVAAEIGGIELEQLVKSQ